MRIMKLQFFRFLLASSSIFSLLHKSYASLSDIFNVPKDSKEVDPHNYGVDVSFPIHYYLDRSKAPVGYDRYAQMMKGCYDRYSKRECDSTERARLAMNRDQPRSQHNYTEMGFKKLRVPLSAWEPLLQFYENNKAKKRPETWPRGNTYVNHWETPSYLVSFEDTTLRGGWAVKDLIWNGVKPIIENWVGHRVKPVSLYGIRIYQEGAMLSTREFTSH